MDDNTRKRPTLTKRSGRRHFVIPGPGAPADLTRRAVFDGMGQGGGFGFATRALSVSIPTNLTVAIDSVSGGLLISWTGTASTYKVYYRLDGGAWTLIDETAETSYTYVPTAPGEYEFAVSGVKGSLESDKAEWVSSDGIFDDISDEEGIALMSLYEATDGDNWTTNTNWLTDSTVNNWHGVTVAGGTVTKIELPTNALNGDASGIDFLAEFTGLTDLDLTGNASYIGAVFYDVLTSGALKIATLAGEAMFFHETIDYSDYAGVTGTSTPHKLTMIDSAGLKAIGYGGNAGGGKGTIELMSNGDVEAGIPFLGADDAPTRAIVSQSADFAYAGANSFKIAKDASVTGNGWYVFRDTSGAAYGNGALLEFGFYGYIPLGAGSRYHNIFNPGPGNIQGPLRSTKEVWAADMLTATMVDFTVAYFMFYLVLFQDGDTAYFDNIFLRKYTDIPATGLHLVSAKDGSTRNMTSVESGFNPNLITKIFIEAV